MKKVLTAALGIVVCLITGTALTAGIGSTAFAADTVKIGLLTPLSGPAEIAGRVARAALEFAVDEQNAKGGLMGRKVEILVEDSEMKADVGLRKAKKLILQDKVNFLGVGADDALAIALNRLIPEYKMIQLEAYASAIELTGKEFSRYTFRVYPNTYSLCAGMALTAKAKGFKRFYNMAQDFVSGRDHVRIWKELVQKEIPDAQMVGEDYFPFNTKDFGPYVTKIKAAKPDMIMLGAFGPDVINMVKQSRRMGLETPFMNHFALDPMMTRALGPDADNTYSTSGYSMEIKTPENAAFIKKWHEKHKNDKDFYLWWPFPEVGQVTFGWMMALAAVEKAGSLDPEKIIQTYENFEYKTPIGVWKMRACDHQAIRPMVGQVVKCGPNPYFNGSIDPNVKFCWETPDVMIFPSEKVMVPATPDYNARCH
jgi:branched-chain amino acid transport system substrate-binding protein